MRRDMSFHEDCVGGQECERCEGSGWLEPIGPCSDDSYITSRECPKCEGVGHYGCDSKAFVESLRAHEAEEKAAK